MPTNDGDAHQFGCGAAQATAPLRLARSAHPDRKRAQIGHISRYHGPSDVPMRLDNRS